MLQVYENKTEIETGRKFIKVDIQWLVQRNKTSFFLLTLSQGIWERLMIRVPFLDGAEPD